MLASRPSSRSNQQTADKQGQPGVSEEGAALLGLCRMRPGGWGNVGTHGFSYQEGKDHSRSSLRKTGFSV